MNTHPELRQLRTRLAQIHDAVDDFSPLLPQPPIIDSSIKDDVGEEGQWLHKGIDIPGLKRLKEDIRTDLGALDKFLNDPRCANLPPVSTNAPYIIAVWNELLSAPQPVLAVFKVFFSSNDSAANDKGKKQKGAAQQPPNQPGVKVDVVADNGRSWIRVNTIKNSRLEAEFKEIDSYLTDSDENSDGGGPDVQHCPPTEFDNSLLRMGHSLLEAAKANPIAGTSTSEVPRITLRLTRLDPVLPSEDGTPPDSRIHRTVDIMREMGIDIELGERANENFLPTSPLPTIGALHPTRNVNLDLSALIALISDITHAPLPKSLEEANRRFIPPQEYREFKQKQQVMMGKASATGDLGSDFSSPLMENDINDLPQALIPHARELTNKLYQEIDKALLQEIHDKISIPVSDGSGVSSILKDTNNDAPSLSNLDKIKFWTTAEARDRCLRIVAKIGGPHEKRRASALFQLPYAHAYAWTAEGEVSPSKVLSLEEAERAYWQDSRHPKNFIPLLPIHILPSYVPHSLTSLDKGRRFDLGKDLASLPDDLRVELARSPPFTRSIFWLQLYQVCSDILSQENPIPSRHPYSETPPKSPFPLAPARARTTTSNPRLTTHTAQTMHWGATLGWTVLTANRSSVKALLGEMKGARVDGRLGTGLQEVEVDRVCGLCKGVGDENGEGAAEPEGGEGYAAIWIVGPRSLSEGMSSLSQPVSVPE